MVRLVFADNDGNAENLRRLQQALDEAHTRVDSYFNGCLLLAESSH